MFIRYINYKYLLNKNINFRYNEIFFMIDTCQAASMYDKFYSPNILAVASSLVGEDSLSVSVVFVIDNRFNHIYFFLQL